MQEFVAQNDLEKLFLAACADPAARPAFYRGFLNGSVIIMNATAPGSAVPVEKIELRVRMLKIEGVSHLPVFTSMKRIEEFGHREGHYHEINTRPLLQMLPDTPVLVNPGSAHGMRLSEAQVAALLANRMPDAGDAAARPTAVGGLEITAVTDPPLALLRLLAQLFKTRDAVRVAYVVNIRNPAEAMGPHPLVCVEAAEAAWDPLIREIMQIVNANSPAGMTVDVCRLDDRPFSVRLRKEAKSFYRR